MANARFREIMHGSSRGPAGQRCRPRPIVEQPPSGRANLGFTLVEVMVAALVSIAAIVAGFAAYAGTMHSWEGTARLTDVQREASLAVEIMAREIRYGSSVSIGADGDSISIYYDTGTADSLTARYYVDESNHLVDLNGNAVTTDVATLSFASADGKAIDIDILVEDDRGTAATNDDQHVLMSSTAVCRN